MEEGGRREREEGGEKGGREREWEEGLRKSKGGRRREKEEGRGQEGKGRRVKSGKDGSGWGEEKGEVEGRSDSPRKDFYINCCFHFDEQDG